ncbi:dihydrodipicolinate synthase family protein [Micromonospora endophytica]|uniref:Dihydrodipicolinate synthase family protein n=1 Tax=Micromonospora endophytica TaxID=515350 RepID=A0A2W2DGP4_9ACTN|nr:dihydrodipicolinate synthase family protein [Micromonospora endophytica]PZF99909.1 dihydrodipicolinate synthase family protein [Micromonospora endophytica]RIW49508.1 dihydrodipicolinate synthase family protein [Micromonospora endophytica]
MTGTEVTLPDGRRLRLTGGAGYPRPDGPPRSRIAYAAAHVVADPQADNTPGTPATLDWDRTLAFRHHLWSYGLGVAEAMDTAQRGMGLDYSATRELIRRSAAEARAAGGRIVAGVTTDQLPAGPASLPEVTAAYREQLDDVQAAGAVPVLMCSRHLAAAARVPEDYLRVYDELLTAADRPVVLHWLGPMFDPALTGYWGSTDLDLAADTVVELIKNHASRVDGIKMSLLDAGREVALRRRLPADVRLYTGDDFNYPELIRGDEQGHSDALLGVFAAIAPAASAALAALDRDDLAAYDEIFAPTVPLARHLFAAPTWYYKTGIVFLAWLAGHQDHFTMVGGLQSGRSPAHLATLLTLADAAGLLPDAELAAARARAFFTVAGVTQ